MKVIRIFGAIALNVHRPVPKVLLNRIKLLGIQRPSIQPPPIIKTTRPAHRGVKGGRRRRANRDETLLNQGGQEYEIHTIITSRKCKSKYNCNGALLNNLTNVQIGKKYLAISFWNAQSIGNKTQTIEDYILYTDLDILVITESWLGEEDPVIIGECTPSGYSLLNFARIGDKHGGIAIIYKSVLNLSISQPSPDTGKYKQLSMHV